ncbi:MAG TPA: SDR family oxidoreductase [bacterium]|nr:SDR family oxidoreductase [bacterium]
MSTEQFDLTGKAALITGSSRGLGYALAQGLGEAGAKIILNGRNRERLDNAVEKLGKEGLDVSGAPFDVTSEEQVASAVGMIEEERSPIDILVNNAGITTRELLDEMELHSWKQVLETNLDGVYLTSKYVVQGMIKRKRGKIINICSLMSEIGRETTGAYTASKGGVKMLTKAMTVDWARHNIQVNGIGPGYFLTDLTQPLTEDPEFDRWLKKRTPARRLGNPKELTGAAVFLASSASDFVNGHIIYVDGGILASL